MRKQLTGFTKDTEKCDKRVKKWAKNISDRTGKSAEAVEDFGKKSMEAGKRNGKATAMMTA